MASNVVNHVCLLLYLGARTGFQTAQDQRRGKGIFFIYTPNRLVSNCAATKEQSRG